MSSLSIGNYLLSRLHELGVSHIFGVPGDFALGFFDQIQKSKVHYVGTCNELNAAYAADGYARLKRIGALAVTYGVGELSALNGIAGAFAESVPVVLIVGAPTTDDHRQRPLLHHTLGNYMIPMQQFKPITVAQTMISSPATAAAEIDRVLRACLYYSKPVYISLPSDMTDRLIESPAARLEVPKLSCDQAALNEAVREAAEMLNKATKPIIVVDDGVARNQQGKQVRSLIEHSGIPFSSMLMGKAVVDESHPQFIGIYMGARSREYHQQCFRVTSGCLSTGYVRQKVETADAVLHLGVKLTDFNTAGFSYDIAADLCIGAHHHQVKIKNHVYENVPLDRFIAALSPKLRHRMPSEFEIKPATQSCTHRPLLASAKPASGGATKMTHQRLFDRISSYIPPGAIVVSETGNALFGMAETMLPPGSTHIAQVFYGSIGYAVGATLGAAIAEPDRPVVLVIGDGSFQVTCQELSTMIRLNIKPTIILINNDGYTIERTILDGAFNDIAQWKYAQLPEVFNGEKGHKCLTEGDFEKALSSAKFDHLSFIEVKLDRWDCSEVMKTAGKAMHDQNKMKSVSLA